MKKVLTMATLVAAMMASTAMAQCPAKCGKEKAKTTSMCESCKCTASAKKADCACTQCACAKKAECAKEAKKAE